MYKPYPKGSFEIIQGIKIFIPPKPPIHEIQGFDLPKKDQKWKRNDYPSFWDEVLEEEADLREDDEDYRDQRLEEYRAQEWKRRIEGHWVFINGRARYLPGKYYYYLQWVKNDNGYPSYREIDREEFLFTQYCFEDPFCLGYVKIGPRGFGKTSKESAITLEEMTRTPHRRQAAIQSKSKDDAKDKIFRDKMVPVYLELPEFFKPESNHGSNPENKLSFFRDAVKGKKAKRIKADDDKELKNVIYPVPAKEKTLDGGTYAIIIQDEIGKCLKKGTRVLMLDGSYKNAEEIIVGDRLMGNDSTPRKVLGLGRGKEMCYDVISRWNKWGCNESHILSVKVCSANIIKGYSKGDILNISIMDYLKLKEYQKKHLMLYKVGVEYTEKHHQIPPYLLGLWLGDGTKSKSAITSVDPEIIEYIYDYAEKNKLEVSVDNGLTYTIYSRVKRRIKSFSLDGEFAKEFDSVADAGSFHGVASTGICASVKSNGTYAGHRWQYVEDKHSPFREELKEKNLLMNKHIPSDYLIDSRENRLQLLAGLIDTDGHKCNDGNRRNYEIVQKSKVLAEGIKTLIQSLGFGSSLIPKIATMKRKDGSVYSCEVYRVYVFGLNLHEIPCRIARKKYDKLESHHIRTRNPLNSGFKVEATGVEDYYGFSIDGNKLFIIEDFQVTHNTSPKEEADVDKRWQVNRFCVYRDNVKRGMLLGTSTIEEMKEGGAECFKIWNKSDYNNKTANGFTVSGAYRYITSALDTTYFDEFGNSLRDKARIFHDAERLARKDDPNELSSYIRKNPYDADEAFTEDGENCEFNSYILNKRLQELNLKEPVTIGDFEWTNGIDSKVRFVSNPNGKFKVAWLPVNEHETNLVEMGPVLHKDDGTKVQTWRPLNDKKFRGGQDPVEAGIETVDKRVSDTAMYIEQLFDITIDTDPNLVYTEETCGGCDYKIGKVRWKTNRPIVEYIARNDDPVTGYEETIKVIRFFGCSIFPETNKAALRIHLVNRGYEDFIKYRPKETWTNTSGNQNTPGAASVEPIIQQYLLMIKSYVNNYGHLIPFKRLVIDLLKFRRSKIKIHDPTVAFGFTMMACLGEAKSVPVAVEMHDYFRTYKINGGQTELAK